MSQLRPFLNSRDFWRFYHLRGDFELSRFDAAAPLPNEIQFHSLQIQMDCPDSTQLVIDVNLDFWMITLSLQSDCAKHQLGWWDDARWHPFALRWKELDQLVTYWESHPDNGSATTVDRLLLLIRFVGFEQNAQSEIESARTRVRTAYRVQGLFDESELEEMVNSTVILPTEDDYHWSEHNSLGWTFGGEYPCYSLRNPEHQGSNEGAFPFLDFNRLMSSVSSR